MRQFNTHAFAAAALIGASPLIGCGGGTAASVSTTNPASPPPTTVGARSIPIFFGLEAQGVGDPNPFFKDGRYYVYYLQNEGRHPWRMSSSSDLTSWSPPVETVPVGQAGESDYWIGSGSLLSDPAGGFRIFYTGHLPGGNPKEIVMSSRAKTLDGPWIKVATPRFSGDPPYDRFDFRDPLVLWNEEAGAYWLLITTRHAGRAAVGLYSSPDLISWSAQAPLYTEVSPLNLEVPDLFQEDGDWYLLYSDQRAESRQTRYLKAGRSPGPYAYGPFDALDGRHFYAGKTAGAGRNRLLFGWVPNREGRSDSGELRWGGDLIAHAIGRHDDGSLAVNIAPQIERQFTTVTARLSRDQPAGAAVGEAALISAELSLQPQDKFGVSFRRGGNVVAVVELDPATQTARFRNGSGSADAPEVRFPVSEAGDYHLRLLLDPARGFGILYINRFRALSFRFYGLNGTVPGFFSEGDITSLTGDVRSRSPAVSVAPRSSTRS